MIIVTQHDDLHNGDDKNRTASLLAYKEINRGVVCVYVYALFMARLAASVFDRISA